MGILAKPKKQDELTLVFHVGSAAVSGALFYANSAGVPKIIFTAKEPIPAEREVNMYKFLPSTLKSLEIVAKKIHAAGLGAPRQIFCVLGSPWCVSQTRVIALKKNVPFVFTAKLAESLMQKEAKLFKEEHLAKQKLSAGAVRVFELKNIKTLLNGYEAAEPLNRKGKELEMWILISMSGEQILKKFEETVEKVFSVPVKFSSFTLSLFTLARDVEPSLENFILMDIGGEVTEISMVKKNVLHASASFPQGHNFFARRLSVALRHPLGEVDSLFSLFKAGHAEKSLHKKIAPIADELKKEWSGNLSRVLHELSGDISMPSSVYLSADGNWADFFMEIIHDEEFNQYDATDSKFSVVFLNPQMLHGLAAFSSGSMREPNLIISAVYINRFLTF